MSFQRPTLTQLVDRIQNDFVSRLTLAGAVLRRAVIYVLSRVLAGAAHMMHGHLEFLGNQIFADISESSYLDRQATMFGVSRKAATFARGNLTATGTNGTVIPIGTVLTRAADGAEYTVDSNQTISGGVATLPVTAVLAGIDYNADVGVELDFQSPIVNVASATVVATGGLTGGADIETDAELRVRLLERLQNPPAGGDAQDYVEWALAVAGVTRAWVYPLELGAGTVVVRFVRDDDGTGTAIIPSAGEVTAVQTAIDALRPVTANVTVVAPVPITRDFTIHIVPDNADARAAVQAELEDLIGSVEPGGTLLISQIEKAIGVAAGIIDFTVTVPAADVTYATGQIPIFGTITWA